MTRVERPSREHILREIRRLAEANGGKPVGKARFATETGIAESAWRARYWARFGDAVAEAGYERNEWQSQSTTDDGLLVALAEVVRIYGRYPSVDELKMRRRSDDQFPSEAVFRARFGGRDAQIRRLIAFADSVPGFEDIAKICAPLLAIDPVEMRAEQEKVVVGFVYLVQMAEYYKVGRTNDVDRRMPEIGLRLPAKEHLVHVIETDDPSGIEKYWHKRFETRHSNGEWFTLTEEDVAAFCRRTYM